jgi:hypothetical protein
VLYTIKWWRDGEKPVGIEYRSLSPHEIEPIIRELMHTARVRLIEIRDGSGDLVAHYPDANKHRPRTR